MKNVNLFSLIIIFLLLATAAFAQVTSVSQLEDVKPTDDYYQDLQSLVERYGIVGGDDLKVAGDDIIPMPAKDKTGLYYFPQTPLTNRQFAILLNNGLNRMNELIAVAGYDDEIQKDKQGSFGVQLFSTMFSDEPLNKLNVRSASQAKGLKPDFKEFESMESLIERWGIGSDLLDKDGTYNRTKTYSEKELIDILGNVFRQKPVCVSNSCYVGELVLDCKNKKVTRARFARIYNQLLNDFNEKLQAVVLDAKTENKIFDDDKDIKKLSDAVRIIKASNDISVSFKTGSNAFVSDCFSNVPQIADLLKQLSAKTSVEVGVHSDNAGSEMANIKLTQSRAEAIRNELIKYGVKPENLTARGYGSSKPIASNTTTENRAKNRRVQFLIVKL